MHGAIGAIRYPIAYRGSNKEGRWADVAIFDVTELQNRSTLRTPERRSHEDRPNAREWTDPIDYGKLTGAKPAQVLYGPGRASSNSTQR